MGPNRLREGREAPSHRYVGLNNACIANRQKR